MTKKCFKCGIERSIEAFYRHPKMADGYLNKCKICTREDVIKRYNDVSKNPHWIEKERARGREKSKRLKYKSNHSYEVTKLNRQKYPEKYAAHSAANYIKLEFVGAHRHHWSYNKEHYKDVIQLSKDEHMKAHRFLIYDQERKMYRTTSGELLDSKERHLVYIKKMVQTMPD